MKKTSVNTPDYISESNTQKIFDFIRRIEKETYPETPLEFHSEITAKSIPDFLARFENKDIKILDIGCGQGPALKIFKENNVEAVGITLNEEDVKICRSKGFDVLKMDQSFLDFEDNEFDGIWARHVLEHSFMPYYTLCEYYRVLKPGGILYIEVPTPDSPFSHEDNPNHYSILTEKMWGSLLHKSGFEVIDSKVWKIEYEKVNDLYQVIYARKKAVGKEGKTGELYLALSKGENFGWGVCSKYLNKEVPLLYPAVKKWDFTKEQNEEVKVEGKVFHALTGIDFKSISRLRGTENFGYTFFENELIPESVKNANNYDKIIGGSTWNKEKLIEKGITNADVLIQGIDPELFYPINEEKDDELFVIFSGGKFELRKGQDLVLKALKIVQQKYPDIVLINAWYNMWPKTMELMERSSHINFELKGASFKEQMENIYRINDLDLSKILTSEIVPAKSLRELFKVTDIGLFPNRCEGGTNLVLMEYMACGKPAIASYNSGHKDIITETNSIPLKEMKDFKIFNANRDLWAHWYEPSVDEIVAKIEWAYNHRKEIRQTGKRAGEFMKDFTWKKSAEALLKIVGLN